MVSSMCIAAANRIIELTNEYNSGKPDDQRIVMTGKRLQKMLYFCEVEHMKASGGQSMFKDEFYAWPSGPVIPSVYYQFMQYQNGTMDVASGSHSALTNTMQKVIDKIFDLTKEKDTVDLVKESHIEGGPWHQIYNEEDDQHNRLIPKDKIYDFYSQHRLFAAE